MKKIFTTAGIFLAIGASTFANAERHTSNIYAGIGRIKVESGEFDYAMKNNFINIGYNLNESFSTEFQYSSSYSNHIETIPENPITQPYSSTIISSLKTTAIYGVYRSSGTFYLKAKFGYMQETISEQRSFMIAHSKQSNTYSDFAGGAGIGYKFGRSHIELEYVSNAGAFDLNYTSLGYIWNF